MTGVRSRQEKVFEAMAHAVLILLTVLAVAPFLLMLSGSLTDNATLTRYGYQFWPKVFSMEAYEYIIREWAQIGNAYFITIAVTAAGTVLSLFLVSTASFALSQKEVPGLNVVFVLILITLLFNGGAVSSYIIYTNLFHIKNTIWALLIPNLMLNGFNLILVRNYMMHSIPEELQSAAEIDGAGVFKIYLKIILPLSKPIMATVGLLTALGYWNDWTNGLYFITDSNLYSVQLLLNKMNENIQYLASHSELGAVQQSLPGTSIRMAIAVVGILPVLIIYPFFQKYFAQGITMGAVKG
ncbi:carbohydrate ABC transporter permease [Lachnotalea sp. AF33-28]|uniref:carbohydrate ABC transporter permease n=1 Tax=Lachnotalea sp. AF33-28 TaxID=2292046 RepID=UPI000E54A768|nr:carbohydrate ABC transporter permease [Lachnotalea sp. AF33-28]RHP34345.1 carbohydrate ABC transporter permease [Lachnotalea sp. AF33-28]